jgi:putative membrane protein
MNTNRADIWLLIVAVVLFLFYLAINAHTHITNFERVPFIIVVPAAAALAFAHAGYMLGWKRASLLLGITLVISFSFEYFGQRTGFLFGPYCYTDLLGYRAFGRIPLLIPIAWFSMVYPSYVIANMLGEGQPISAPRRTVWWICGMAILSAMTMTAWDLVMDPVMSYTAVSSGSLVNDPAIWDHGEVGVPAWRWLSEHVPHPGACMDVDPLPHGPRTHFGVPFQNYLGWLITATTVFLIFRLLEHRFPVPKGRGRLTRVVVLMPIFSYGTVALGDVWLGYPEIADVRLISPFVMGVLFIASSMLVFRPKPDLDPRTRSSRSPPLTTLRMTTKG